jgi:hypothetical protein
MSRYFTVTRFLLRAMSAIEEVLGGGRRNAAFSWLLIAVVFASGIASVFAGRLLWSVFAFVVVLLAIVPPVVYRSGYVMLPAEVLVLAALPVLGLAVGTEWFTNPITTYLAVAAVGLVLVVELQSFTALRLSDGFAVVLVVAATMAAAALWALFRWGISLALGFPFALTNDALMIEFLYSALAGVGAGVIFAGYFHRFVSARERLPPEIEVEVFADR